MNNSKYDKEKVNKFAKYSGLAFQLLAYIALGYFLGKFIDTKMGNTTPIGIALCTVLFLSFALYSIIKDVLKTK